MRILLGQVSPGSAQKQTLDEVEKNNYLIAIVSQMFVPKIIKICSSF